MGAHCGVSQSSEKMKEKETNSSNASRPFIDYDKQSSRISSNLEASSKSKESNILKANEIYRMNSNNNHHYHYMYSSNGMNQEL